MEGILTAKIANIKKNYFFLSFLYIKGLNIKMSLISAKGYENAGVSHLIIITTGKLWVSMKDVGDGLGVKNVSDLVLKKIHGIYEKKKLTKEEIRCFKMTEREIYKKFTTLNEDELNIKSNKSVFVKNNIMTNIIRNC